MNVNYQPPPPPGTHDTPATYARVLALFCLRHIPDHGAIATAALTDQQLESAALGLNHALTQRSIVDEQTTPELVYNRLADCLVFVRLMQAGRAKIAQEQLDAIAQAAGIGQPSQPPDSHPTGGKPVYPPPPAPKPIAPEHQPQPRQPVAVGDFF